MNSVKIQGAEHPVSEIFSDDFVFSIPPYQRPYAWTTEQAGALLEDLLEFLGDGDEPIDSINPYFLGSIVLIKGDAPDAQIIDGQQRLTTLTILLAALRASLSHELAKYFVTFLYQEGNKLKGTPNLYRMSLRDRDNDFFQRYIQIEEGINKLKELNNADLRDSQKLIKENAILFLIKLQNLSEERRFRLAQFIVKRCFLVVVSTPDLESAYRIFSVLNDRGLNLTRTDIFKADIIGRIPDQDKQKYSSKWEDIEESLGRADFDELLSHIRTIYQKYKRSKKILEDLRDQLEGVDSRDFIDETLKPFSKAFYDIRNASYQTEDEEKAKTINELLKWLNTINNSDWIPPAILLLSRNSNNPAMLVQFFSDLERLAAGLLIQDINDNLRGHRYAQVMNYIEQGKDLYNSCSPLQLESKEKDRILSVLDGDIYLNRKLCNYVLRRLDAEISEGTASYDFSKVTIEHVLPQNPASHTNWLSWFPNQKQRDKYANRLGNLVLLSRQKNRDAKNFDFQDKKEEYFTSRTGVSTFALTVQVLRETVWTPHVVERRQKELVEILKRLWRLQ
ncbi:MULTISPECIES: DUF262 domain-containing protein [unclassified Coleofasciculus]|uniref:DUF262 domain-containing protein n=1 Tax=unclassified Coleofasciculus TaxID=2692782 RepID=UPI001880C5D7|nr:MULTISPECIES: DUF262 domain-containing protein [unclassified Coleofasciculus]MBE9128786.1 DUF262 domain-containing protein [Coleofasciculus sp. LEGE 07081]MBE9151508.1 DUF262 domain-containing protein [Coleofasciculus sp. LEGE 07092]